MYPDYFSLQVAEEHYKDLLREAELERLIHLDTHRTCLPERSFCWMGQQLVAWGYWLQARYSQKQVS